MAAELTVELSDLSGWSMQVRRAGDASTTIESYARSHVADGDFGAILELITADYEALIPDFHGVLGADGSRLSAVSTALGSLKDDFRDTDAQVAQNLGVGRRISEDSNASDFLDAESATPVPAPDTGAAALPEVTFGSLLDTVCELLSYIGGPDPREYVTKWIAGDVEKASLQASAWEHAGECVKIVERNLAAGRDAIGVTWQGRAANAASAHMDRWITALADQSTGMTQMGAHLRDMVEQAINMAQVVVDIIKTVISLATAALSSAYIPAWGQWKLIKSAKEALTLINNARKVITVFWNALVMIKDGIVMIAQAFVIDALPPVPVSP